MLRSAICGSRGDWSPEMHRSIHCRNPCRTPEQQAMQLSRTSARMAAEEACRNDRGISTEANGAEDLSYLQYKRKSPARKAEPGSTAEE